MSARRLRSMGLSAVVMAATVMLLPAAAHAIDADTPIADREKAALYERLTEEVRCLVCQNQTVADSTAPLAADLRREIRKMVESGRSESEIKQFLTERYGDFVLYKPRFSGLSLLLWLAPVLLAFIGSWTLWRILRRRTALPVTTEEEDREAARADWD